MNELINELVNKVAAFELITKINWQTITKTMDVDIKHC